LSTVTEEIMGTKQNDRITQLNKWPIKKYVSKHWTRLS
jgi:hypothetical protein